MHVSSIYYLNFSQKQLVVVLFMYAKRERYWWFRSASGAGCNEHFSLLSMILMQKSARCNRVLVVSKLVTNGAYQCNCHRHIFNSIFNLPLIALSSATLIRISRNPY